MQEILGWKKATYKGTSQVHLLVWWERLPKAAATWEPVENFCDNPGTDTRDKLVKYFRKNPGANSALAKKKMDFQFKSIVKIHGYSFGPITDPATKLMDRLILNLSWKDSARTYTEWVGVHDVIAGVFREEYTTIYQYV